MMGLFKEKLQSLLSKLRNESRWRNSIFRTVVLFLLLAGYLWLAQYLGSFVASYSHHLWLEGLLALYLYGLGYVVLRPSRWRAVLAMVPLLVFYLVSDVFYLAFGKVFRLVNLNELPELVEILPLSYSVPLAVLILLPIVLLAIHIMWRPHRHALLAAAPLLVILLLLYSAPSGLAQMIVSAGSVPIKYSDAKSVERNGRLTMMLYRMALRLKAMEELAPYRDREQYEISIDSRLHALSGVQNKRNIHLIVLESFIDPRLFTKLKFSSDPAHPDFIALFGERTGLSVSPVFGGATAQAEFEILCGVPALEVLSSVEFNIFNGSPAYCLPGQLKKLGYLSVASNTYKPDFFNAVAAYKGTGFEVSYFPREFSHLATTYLTFGNPGVEEYTFDGDLLTQNLAFVTEHLRKSPEKPLFNYLLTIYGHTPHLLDPQLRPEFIELHSEYFDDHLIRAANQFYYRTQAIADHVKKLIALDPESLIVLVSDHVPPLRNGPNTYKALDYLDNIEKSYYHNPIFIIDRGKPVTLPVIHHYDIPALVLDSISDGAYCETQRCSFTGSKEALTVEQRLEDYLKLMAHASE